jgi:tRNA 2-thiouridine synthesizing protein A
MEPRLLDLKGLKCPLPALKTRKALSGMMAGDEIMVTCTDPMAAIDIPHLCQVTGDTLVAQETREDALLFTIRKA